MAKNPISTSGLSVETPDIMGQQFTDPDTGLVTDPRTTPFRAGVETGGSNNSPSVFKPTAEMSITERLNRLEMLALQYFGSHHFEAPSAAFNAEAERESARIVFERQMREIEERVRAPKAN